MKILQVRQEKKLQTKSDLNIFEHLVPLYLLLT